MKTRELRNKRNDYRIKSTELQKAYLNKDLSFDRIEKLKKEQDDNYKKFTFYDNFLKALEKQSK